MKLKKTLLAISLALYTTGAGFAIAAGYEDTFKQAAAAFQSGDFDKAADLFEQAGDAIAKKNSKQAAQIWANAAVANVKADDYKGAAEVYEKILSSKAKLDSDKKISFYKNLVFCYGQLNEPALQVDTIERALKENKKISDADKVELLASAGDALRKMELYRFAAEAYEKALKLTPKDDFEQIALTLTGLGLCQGNLGDYSEAILNLSWANEIASKNNIVQTMSDTHSNLGILNWEKGDYKKALADLDKALNIERENNFERNIGVDKNNAGLVYKSIGNYPKAMELFNESSEIAKKINNPRDEGIAVVNKALVYRILGDHANANKEYSYAVSLFQQADFKEGLAGAYLGIGKMLEISDNDYHGALDYYLKALDIYETLELQRGIAETLLQIGELYQKPLKGDLNVLESAKPAEEKQQASLAGAFNKYTGKNKDEPQESGTRDLAMGENNAPVAVEEKVTSGLSFVDEDAGKPLAESDEASIAKSKEYIDRAFEIVSDMGIKELLWAAHQDLGFIELKLGNLEASEQHYAKAIDIVSSIFLSGSDVEAFGEYMADKEELYQEAQAVCSLLYTKTKKQDYVFKIQTYGEMLTNEIQKASSALANITFEDKKKQEQYEQLTALQKKLAALEKSKPQVKELAKDATAEEKAKNKLQQRVSEEQAAEIKSVEADYKKAFAQWREDYPNDTVMFDAASRVDIPTIQQNITPEQVVLMYTQLPENLLITVIKTDSVNCYNVVASQKEIDRLVREEVIIKYISKDYGRKFSGKGVSPAAGEAALKNVSVALNKLYNYFIAPVADEIADSKRLYVVNTGLVAQLPFGALVSGYEDDGNPIFLVENYDVGIVRPSFITAFNNPKASSDVKKMLAVANPSNQIYPMSLLAGTITEVASASKMISDDKNQMDIASEIKYDKYPDPEDALEQFKTQFSDPSIISRPTEAWLRDQLANNKYEMIYFSTHGMPYSNVLYCAMGMDKVLKKKNIDYEGFVEKYQADPTYKDPLVNDNFESYIRTIYATENYLPSNSPLNGFLYLSTESDTMDSLIESVPSSEDGMLTMKEILQMPDSYFSNTEYVILSACNTGVTYVPDAVKGGIDLQEIDEDSQKEIEKMGLVPGVDQVSFVDSFMRRGVKNVYGTFWFVDDAMSSELLTRFMTNLTNEELNLDPVGAMNEAQRSLIRDGKEKKFVISKKYIQPQQPYLWACGGIFGK